ncbi:MAG: FTR1 family protein [Promethearchaeota archaeon]
MELVSLVAFLITLRETMEAALIVGILLAYLTKTQNDSLKRDVWIGALVAVIVSIIAASFFVVITGGFEGETEILFEGIIMIVAAVILTHMILWMFRNAKDIRNELEDQVNVAISGNRKYAIFSLAFIAVMREGIETVLFIAGITTNEPWSAVLFSGSIGIIIAIILGIGLFKGSIKLDLSRFFNITSVLLILFAAGLFAQGIHEFQELNWFGASTEMWNEVLWDTSSFLNDKDDGLGSLLRALFGYQDTPTLVELLSYIGYWLVIGTSYLQITKRPQIFNNIRLIRY